MQHQLLLHIAIYVAENKGTTIPSGRTWPEGMGSELGQPVDTLAAAISMKIINNITHYLRCGLRGASGWVTLPIMGKLRWNEFFIMRAVRDTNCDEQSKARNARVRKSVGERERSVGEWKRERAKLKRGKARESVGERSLITRYRERETKYEV
jgi:hypothetical protein